jgi:hypothetical protein
MMAINDDFAQMVRQATKSGSLSSRRSTGASLGVDQSWGCRRLRSLAIPSVGIGAKSSLCLGGIYYAPPPIRPR